MGAWSRARSCEELQGDDLELAAAEDPGRRGAAGGAAQLLDRREGDLDGTGRAEGDERDLLDDQLGLRQGRPLAGEVVGGGERRGDHAGEGAEPEVDGR